LKFKQQVSNKPFIFCGSSKEKVFWDIAIQKMKVEFYKEEDLTDNSPESAYFRMKASRSTKHEFRRKPLPESVENISKRRIEKLRDFLPITLERLEYTPIFKDSRTDLKKNGFFDWQIIQAACNIVVSFRLCNCIHYATLKTKSAQMTILEHLLNEVERPDTIYPPEHFFSKENLKKQIVADMLELLTDIGDTPKNKQDKALLKELSRRGFTD
jgi:hypothetical protein